MKSPGCLPTIVSPPLILPVPIMKKDAKCHTNKKAASDKLSYHSWQLGYQSTRGFPT